MPNAVDTLQQDLACPACGYNLRGLRGQVAACPECGHACDLAELIARRWTGAWYAAPFFNQLLLPVACATCGLIVAACAGTLGADAARSDLAVVLGAIATIVLTAWGALIRGVWKRWPGGEGVALSLLAHGVFVAYMAALYGAVATAVALFVAGPIGKVAAAVGLAACVATLYASRRGERFIAERCIRRYLAGR